MEFITISRKRCREDQLIESDEYSEPDTKRMRLDESACCVITEELLLLLEEPVESPVEIVDQDLESVIRSFEKEIYSTTDLAEEVEDPIEFLLEGSNDVIELGDELQLGLGFEENWKTSCYDLFGSLGVVDDAGEGIIVNYEDGGFARCDDVGDNFLLLGNDGKMNDFVSSSWPARLPAL